MVLLTSAATDRHYGKERTLWQRVSMFVCSAWWCRPTSVWRSTLTLFVTSVSSGFAGWKEFGESVKTLVHAFVTSRVDYGNIILVGAPKSVTNKLQRVLNAAARIVTGIRKYDRGLSHLLHTELHWLDVPERVLYKLALMVHRCLQDKAPQYLSNYCVPVSEVASRQQLRSASRHQLLLIPRYRLRTFGRRAFAVAGPTFWSSLADELRTYSGDRFNLALKTFLFATYQRIQRIRGFRGDAPYKLMIDIDIDIRGCKPRQHCNIIDKRLHWINTQYQWLWWICDK